MLLLKENDESIEVVDSNDSVIANFEKEISPKTIISIGKLIRHINKKELNFNIKKR